MSLVCRREMLKRLQLESECEISRRLITLNYNEKREIIASSVNLQMYYTT